MTHKFRGGAKKLNGQGCEQARQGREAERESAQPATRRRYIKDWMRRATNKEENWRVGDPQGYQAAAEAIAKIKAGAPEIKARYPFRDYYPVEEYGFEKPFGLADRLIGLLETYLRDKRRVGALKASIVEHEQRLAEIRKTGTLENATSMELFALAIGGYSRVPRKRRYFSQEDYRQRAPLTPREKHTLKRAARIALQGPRKEGGAGRYLTAEAMLARGLAGTYYLGTGKWPVTGNPGQFRGPYARFARECLGLLGVEVTDATLRDQAAWKRAYLQGREE